MIKTKYFLYLIFFYSIGIWANDRWIINHDHSQIQFSVTYLKFIEIEGSFKEFNGHIEFDADDLLANKLWIEIQSQSINTLNNLRDGHLKSADFFDTKKFPLIEFKSSEIHPIKPNFFEVHGILKIKSHSNPIKIEYELKPNIKDSWGKENRFIKFQGSLNRKHYGLTWDKSLDHNALLLGDQVHFRGTIQLQLLKNMTPTSNHLIPNTAYSHEREKLLRGEIKEINMEKNSEKSPLISPRNETVRKNKILTNNNTTSVQTNIPTKSDLQLWKISIVILGFLGFIASIILFYEADQYLQSLLPTPLQDSFFYQTLCNFISLIFPILYTLALWQVWIFAEKCEIYFSKLWPT